MNTIVDPEKFKAWARMGYAARGVVYLVIGGLAVWAAIGKGGRTTDSKGALVEITQHSFGTVLLAILIIGLFGYVIWRLIQAIKDADGHGSSAKGLAIRGGLIASAISHAFLALWALKFLLGDKSDSHNSEQYLATDLGQIIAGLLGIAFIVAGLAHIFKGWTARFERYMNIPGDKNLWAKPLCRFGLISRGVVWCIIGWFFINSSLSARSGEVKGIVDALQLLRSSNHGNWLFGIVAAGLFAFGIYSLLEAVYRDIKIDFNEAGLP